jgi:type IV pilus assembly protein PilA
MVTAAGSPVTIFVTAPAQGGEMLEKPAKRTWHGACLRPETMRRRFTRGFTLVELLIVVAMVGVLAALGMVGYRKYISAAHTGEAKSVIQALRNAEHQYKVDTLTYLKCADSYTDYYPQGAGGPNDRKWHWVNDAHPKFECYRSLNVDPDGPVRFAYAVVAGSAADTPLALDASQWKTPPQWPVLAVPGPWYVIQATGNLDGDSELAVLVSSSFDNKIYIENEGE